MLLIKFSTATFTVKMVVTMHNTKNLFLEMLKIYLQIRNALIKFPNKRSIVALKKVSFKCHGQKG